MLFSFKQCFACFDQSSLFIQEICASLHACSLYEAISRRHVLGFENTSVVVLTCPIISCSTNKCIVVVVVVLA